LVLAEADSALTTSHVSHARPTHRSARREWLVSAGALLIISFLLVLIAGHSEPPGLGRLAAGTSGGHLTALSSVANTGGPKRARSLITGRTRHIAPDGTREASTAQKSTGPNSALSVVTQPHRSTAGGRAPAVGSDQRTPSRALGKSGSRAASQGAKTATRGAGRGAGGSASAQAGRHSAESAPGDRGSGRAVSGRGHTTNSQHVGAGSRAGTSDSTRSSGSHGSAKASASGNNQTHGTGNTSSPSAHPAVRTQRSLRGQNRSAGNSAGAGAGGNPFGRPQTNGLPSGFERLSIQAGSTSARDKSGTRSGNPAGRSGGKGRARSSAENGGGSATAVTLPYIPPSANTAPADNTLLQHYFSSTSTVTGHW
jgi:hypothetical protein